MLFKSILLCSLFLAVVWVALGKTAQIPVPHFTLKAAHIPAPHFALPSSRAVWILCVIHLIYLAVILGGGLFLLQDQASARMIAMGLTPAQVGPFIANVMYAMIAAALTLLLIAAYFTMCKSAWWFTVACHSLLVVCMCRFVLNWMQSMGSFQEGQIALSQALSLYIVAFLLYTGVVLAFAVKKKKVMQNA